VRSVRGAGDPTGGKPGTAALARSPDPEVVGKLRVRVHELRTVNVEQTDSCCRGCLQSTFFMITVDHQPLDDSRAVAVAGGGIPVGESLRCRAVLVVPDPRIRPVRWDSGPTVLGGDRPPGSPADCPPGKALSNPRLPDHGSPRICRVCYRALRVHSEPCSTSGLCSFAKHSESDSRRGSVPDVVMHTEGLAERTERRLRAFDSRRDPKDSGVLSSP